MNRDKQEFSNFWKNQNKIHIDRPREDNNTQEFHEITGMLAVLTEHLQMLQLDFQDTIDSITKLKEKQQKLVKPINNYPTGNQISLELVPEYAEFNNNFSFDKSPDYMDNSTKEFIHLILKHFNAL